jgi:hypothetical protein
MLTKLAPEGFEIANAYLEYGTVEEVANQLQLPQHEVAATLIRKDVKDYLDGVYLDMGYRNRNKLGALLDRMIDAKIEEAEESGVYTKKDLLELITLAHKMRMDEISINQKPTIGTQVQIAQFGEGNYGKLMEKLMSNRGNKNPSENE